MTKTVEDLSASIEESYKLPELILDGRWTKTTHFLLPGLHIATHLEYFTKYFVNAFLEDNGISHIVKNPVFVLFKTPEFDEAWRRFEINLKSSPRCVYAYDVGNSDGEHLVMFLFEFPPAYRSDYHKFLEGEYSNFSEHYKKLFKPTSINSQGETVEASVYGVLYKTDTFRKRLEAVLDETIDTTKEYWEKWSPEREIFRKNNQK